MVVAASIGCILHLIISIDVHDVFLWRCIVRSPWNQMRPLSCLDGEHLIPFLWIKVSVVHVVRCHRWKRSDEYEEQMSAVVDERVKEIPPTDDTSKFKRPWQRSRMRSGACCLFSWILWLGVCPGEVTWSTGEEPWKSQLSSHWVVPSKDILTILCSTFTAKALSVGTITRLCP